MSTQNPSAVPAVPLYALAAIPDENTRLVLQSLIDGWQVRNAASGDGINAFVTRADLTSVTGAVQSNGRLGIFPTFADYAKSFTGSVTPGAVVADIEASLQGSLLFQQLGSSVALLNQNITAEQQARVAAVQAVADNLAAETLARTGLGTTLGGQIATLQTATDDNATLITALGTWSDEAQSSITSLSTTTSTTATNLTALTTRVTNAESSITTLNTTTGNQAQTLTSLATRVGDTESSISNLNITTGNQALTLTTISTTLGQKADTYFQAAAPTGTIATGSLWFDSDDNNKPYRWSGTAWALVESVANLASVTAAITSEQNARVSADNAITESMNNQFSAVNGSIATINGNATTLATSVSSLSDYLINLSSQLGNTQTAIEVEAQARADADGTMFAKYSIKTDLNGYVSGYGLMSTANNSIPTSEFVVRADKFAIGSPDGPGITPRIPFSVLTTADANGNQPGVYMDNVVIKAASITGAYIADLAVDTLKLADNAVTLPNYAETNATSSIVQPIAFTETTEYRWEDTNDLLSPTEMTWMRSKMTNSSTKVYFQTNTYIGHYSYYYSLLANFQPRDYMGQPVVIFYNWDVTAVANYTPSMKIIRIEENAGLDPEPDRFRVIKVPREKWTNNSLTESDLYSYLLQPYQYTHEVSIVNEWYFFIRAGTAPQTLDLKEIGFVYDAPPANKSWIYALVFHSTNDFVNLTGMTKLATIGLKK